MLKIDGAAGTSNSFQRKEVIKPVQTTTVQQNTEPAFRNSLRNDTQVELTRFRLQTAATQITVVA